MNKNLNTALNQSRRAVRLTLFAMATIVIGRWLAANSRVTIWLDESIMVFIANHTPFTPAFFTAVKENIAGMPWAFVEYWAWLQLLRLVPVGHLTEHLEFYLRLPLTFYSLIAYFGSYLMVSRVAKSRALALFTASLLFLGSHLSSHLGGELRFHSSAMAHMVLSWCLLGFLVTVEDKNPAARKPLFIAWAVSAAVCGWTHIYASFSFLLQIMFFTAANMGWVPKTRPAVKKPAGMLTAFFLFLIFNGQIAYFKFMTIQPYSRAETAGRGFSEVLPDVIRMADGQIFIPSVWFWLTLIALFTVQNLIRVRRDGPRQALVFLALIMAALLQIMIIGALGYYYLKWNWGPEAWFARYVMAGVVPFVFLLSYFARDFVPEIYDKIFGLIISGVLIFIFSFNPAFGKPYWGTPAKLDGHPRWVALRDLIKANGAYGKITAVAGLAPGGRHLDHRDVHGDSLDFCWQIYARGPHAVAPITLYYKDDYAGLTPVPCAVREMYPMASGPASEFAVDFCEKDKVYLREFMK